MAYTIEEKRSKTKICRKCNLEKPKLTHFYCKSSSGDGYSARCISCESNGLYDRKPNPSQKGFLTAKNIGRPPNYNRKNFSDVRLVKFNKLDLMPKNWWKILLAFYNFECCKCKSKTDLEFDHVIPISWPDGEHCLSNAQLLCVECNGQKGNRSSADFRNGKILPNNI